MCLITVFTLNCKLNMSVGGACNVFGRADVASSVTELSRRDLNLTWVKMKTAIADKLTCFSSVTKVQKTYT